MPFPFFVFPLLLFLSNTFSLTFQHSFFFYFLTHTKVFLSLFIFLSLLLVFMSLCRSLISFSLFRFPFTPFTNLSVHFSCSPSFLLLSFYPCFLFSFHCSFLALLSSFSLFSLSLLLSVIFYFVLLVCRSFPHIVPPSLSLSLSLSPFFFFPYIYIYIYSSSLFFLGVSSWCNG